LAPRAEQRDGDWMSRGWSCSEPAAAMRAVFIDLLPGRLLEDFLRAVVIALSRSFGRVPASLAYLEES